MRGDESSTGRMKDEVVMLKGNLHEKLGVLGDFADSGETN